MTTRTMVVVMIHIVEAVEVIAEEEAVVAVVVVEVEKVVTLTTAQSFKLLASNISKYHHANYL